MHSRFTLRSRLKAAGLVAVVAHAGRARDSAGGHGDGVESERVERVVRGAGQPPQLSVPHLAMVQGAVYDAVNAIDGGYEGYLLTSRAGDPVRLEGGGGRDGGVPRPAEPRAGAASGAGRPVRGVAGGDPGRVGEDPRDRGR